MSVAVVAELSAHRFGARRDVTHVAGWGTLALVAAGAAVGVLAYRSRSVPRQEQTLHIDGRDVFVYVPANLRTTSHRVLLYFHGNGATIQEVRDRLVPVIDQAVPTLWIVPQLNPDGSAGALTNPGGVRRLLMAVFATVDGLQAWDVDVVQLRIVSHSGGYLSAAAAIERGGVPAAAVGLLDSLYAQSDVYLRAVQNMARFANVYGKTTAMQSLALASTLAEQLGAESALDTTAALDAASVTDQIAAHRATTIRTTVAHSDVPASYLGAMIDGFGE